MIRVEANQLKLPATRGVGHLVAGDEGSWWAWWRVHEDMRWAFASDALKDAAIDRWSEAVASAGTEMVISSLAARADLQSLFQRAVDGVPLRDRDRWATEHGRLLDEWTAVEPPARVTYLGVRVDRTDLSGRFAAGARKLRRFAVRADVPVLEVEEAQSMASDIERRVGEHVALERVPAGEMAWVHTQHVLAGSTMEHPYNQGEFAGLDPRWTRRHVTDLLGDIRVDEGGLPGEPGHPYRHRRYLALSSGKGADRRTWYQCHGTLKVPAAWIGGEWLLAVDNLAIPVDWTTRLWLVEHEAAVAQVEKLAHVLGRQERHGVARNIAAADNALAREYAWLEENPGAPMSWAAFHYRIGAPTRDELFDRAAQLEALFPSARFQFVYPTGGQKRLLLAGLPGAVEAFEGTGPVRDYARPMPVPAAMSAVPFSSLELGDETGIPVGRGIDTKAYRPVFVDLAAGDHPGSSLFLGLPGSGKSHGMKQEVLGGAERGFQHIILDTSDTGEWCKFAAMLPGRTQIVNLTDGGHSIDPFRVIPRTVTVDGKVEAHRHEVALAAVQMLTGLQVQTRAYSRTSELVDETIEQHGTIVIHANAMLNSIYEDVADGGSQLREALRHPLAAGITADADAIDLTADTIVLWMPGLSLTENPDRKQWTPANFVSQLIIYLAMAYARSAAYSTTGRMTVVVFEEAWTITPTPAGHAMAFDIMFKGRKIGVAAKFAYPNPASAAPDLVAQTQYRYLFGIDELQVPTGMMHIGLPRDQRVEAKLRQLSTMIVGSKGKASPAAGVCLFRDRAGRHGWVRINQFDTPAMIEAAYTKPSLTLAS